MAVHKLVLDTIFDEELYTLIGIHCTLEDYRIAYLLNKSLEINLKRKPMDLDFNNGKSAYSVFEWKDHKHLRTWNLVSNICKREEFQDRSEASLFDIQTPVIKIFNLINEFKKVNYFLKIENDFSDSKEKYIINRILRIPQVVTAYSIDMSQLKSKNNLIFS
ncbi:IPExxxVDY family protein [Aestuariivivens sediminis]|uniref:IPExxxVDY family protein n=1 Tax=Aestuariivivens sediminis TaxID=2913557 RepID=UPI001F589CD8|nr:IPExxxVDY family protein [Aestuariivivens sediminis]